jgi:hypothetical protein
VEVAQAGVTVNCLSLGLMDNVAGDWADAMAAVGRHRGALRQVTRVGLRLSG